MYIGKTVDRKKRHSAHINGKKGSKLLFNAMKKYGKNNFTKTIIGYFNSAKDLNLAEKYWIKFFKTNLNSKEYNGKEYGYNLTNGGDGMEGYIPSEETRNKLRKANKGEKHPMFGKKRSEETRQKLSEANKGKKQSEETIKRRIEKTKGKKRSEETRQKLSEANKGKKRSEETRKKQSEAKKGKRNHNFGKKRSEETRKKTSETNKCKKKVQQFDLNGNFIKEFYCINEAGRQTGIFASGIVLVCKGKQKTAGGFIWKYAEDHDIGE